MPANPPPTTTTLFISVTVRPLLAAAIRLHHRLHPSVRCAHRPERATDAAGGFETHRRGTESAWTQSCCRGIQFALTASFHFIFPPISMGLGLMLVAMGIVYLRTKDPKWRQLSFFWVKIYGIVFAMGVATGVVQEFEFGMNWADYSRFVGNVFGSLLAAEGVFAFLLEGGFLG